jgi:Lrp/AsnC family transcriptional regulator, leucine-responsive regulatory protein
MELDNLDWGLLNELQADARTSFNELARRLGASSPTIAQRVRRLEEAGVITGYRATVDAASLGLGVTALIGISLSDAADHEDVAQRLKDLREIEDCWFIAGEDSYMLKVRAADVDGLERTIRRLSGTKGVSRTRSTIVLSTKWENRVGELPEEVR